MYKCLVCYVKWFIYLCNHLLHVLYAINKQLLDEVEQNIVMYQLFADAICGSYLPIADNWKRGTDKSRYFAITEFNNCFIIRLISRFFIFMLVFRAILSISSSEELLKARENKLPCLHCEWSIGCACSDRYLQRILLNLHCACSDRYLYAVICRSFSQSKLQIEMSRMIIENISYN